MHKLNSTMLENIFNLWAYRYSQNPDEWEEILDGDGKPVEDYGRACAIYFRALHKQILSYKKKKKEADFFDID